MAGISVLTGIPAFTVCASSFKTSDNTPVLIGNLESSEVYGITLYDPTGERIDLTSLRTNENGMFFYQPGLALLPGIYQISMRNHRGDFVGTYALQVSGKSSVITPWVVTFGRKSEKMILNEDNRFVVGGVERAPGQVIQGYIRPGEEVAVEFHSLSVIEKVAADERGYFELPIPLSLELGKHTAQLVYLASDQTISKDLFFSFALLPGAFEITEYDALLLPWYERNPSLILRLCLLTLGLHLLLAAFSHSRWGHFKWLALLFPFSPSRLVAVRELA